ncbi:MAG: hypothetical protein ACI8PZ_001076 [Myxococcota bacterium]|jgi:hypothetical protein
MPTRRELLWGAAAAGIIAPFGSARAGGASAKRLLLWYTPNGTVPHRLWPEGGERDFRFAPGSILEPLQPVRDRLVLLKGLQFPGATNHGPGLAAMLTNGDGPETGGRSVDQVVGDHIGGTSRLRTLELGVQTSLVEAAIINRMCYAGPGAMLAPDDDPVSVYRRCFGDVALEVDEAARLRARRLGVVAATRAEVEGMQAGLGMGAEKLAAHLDALADLEHKLSVPPTCAPGDEPLGGAPLDNDRFPDILALQQQLAIQALACGVTHVASIQVGYTLSDVVFTWIGQSEGHHTLSHMEDHDEAGVQRYVDAERWLTERFAALISGLADTPDPAFGGSLLDHTLVMWPQDLGDGRLHTCEDVPFVLAGVPHLLEPGRFLDLGPTNHAHLLVSVAQAFGVPLDTFGDPTAGTGPLPGLFA